MALSSNISPLADRLLHLRYQGLFGGPDPEPAREAILSDPGSVKQLEILVQEGTDEARFLASEMLFAKDADFLSRMDRSRLADVYATALAKNFTETANPWGLPSEDILGPVGDHIVSLGASAVPALTRLLDDDQAAAEYEGSEEATLGSMYQFRVKDFAAFYLSRIKGLSLSFPRDRTKRDAEITKLKSSL